ncbi:hypothetical protein Gohar_023726, partial [Gossypium harknessii]|nr:hypothetical protein [Gossypium harknessii]
MENEQRRGGAAEADGQRRRENHCYRECREGNGKCLTDSKS